MKMEAGFILLLYFVDILRSMYSQAKIGLPVVGGGCGKSERVLSKVLTPSRHHAYPKRHIFNAPLTFLQYGKHAMDIFIVYVNPKKKKKKTPRGAGYASYRFR
jgi:hypothetical protein